VGTWKGALLWDIKKGMREATDEGDIEKGVSRGTGE